MESLLSLIQNMFFMKFHHLRFCLCIVFCVSLFQFSDRRLHFLKYKLSSAWFKFPKVKQWHSDHVVLTLFLGCFRSSWCSNQSDSLWHRQGRRDSYLAWARWRWRQPHYWILDWEIWPRERQVDQMQQAAHQGHYLQVTKVKTEAKGRKVETLHPNRALSLATPIML